MIMRHWSQRVFLNFVLVCIFLLFGGNLCAQEVKTQAIQLSAQGVALYNEGRYEEAASMFEQAYVLIADPNLLFNIGRCHQKLGHIEEAIAFYQRFIASPGVLPKDKKRALERIRVLRIQQTAPPPPTQKQLPPPSPKKPRSRTLEWSLIGSGGAMIIIGAIVGGMALKAQNDLDNATSISSKKDLSNKVHRRAVTSDVFWPIGVAAVAAGTALYFLLDNNEEEEEKEKETWGNSARLSPFVVRGGGGAALGMNF